MHAKPHTEESKAKIADAMKGNQNRLGCKCTDRTRRRMAAAQMRRKK